MALGKKIGQGIKDIIDPKEKRKAKAKDFGHGLKEFFTSPGGIVTVVLFAITIWYVHHATSHKTAKS